MRYKVSGAIAIPKASWGCAPALPNRIRVVFLEATSLRENSLNHPAKGGSTPAFAYQRAAIAPLPCPNLQLGFIKAANSELASFKKCNCNRKNRLQNQFASQMWATRPHLGSIFEKLLHRKTFLLPAARFLQPTCSKLFLPPLYNLRLSAQTIPVPPWNNLYKSEDFHHGNEEK